MATRAELDIVTRLLTSQSRIDRIIRRSEDGTLYTTDAEYYIDSNGPNAGGPSVKIPQWHNDSDMSEEELEENAIAFIDQLDSQIAESLVS